MIAKTINHRKQNFSFFKFFLPKMSCFFLYRGRLNKDAKGLLSVVMNEQGRNEIVEEFNLEATH